MQRRHPLHLLSLPTLRFKDECFLLLIISCKHIDTVNLELQRFSYIIVFNDESEAA